MRLTKIIAASAAGALLVARQNGPSNNYRHSRQRACNRQIGIVFGQFIRHSSELDPVPVGGPFELVDQDDHTVNDKTFLGRPSRSWTTGLRLSALLPTSSTSCSFRLIPNGTRQFSSANFFHRSIPAYGD
jgi:hypothetical protein